MAPHWIPAHRQGSLLGGGTSAGSLGAACVAQLGHALAVGLLGGGLGLQALRDDAELVVLRWAIQRRECMCARADGYGRGLTIFVTKITVAMTMSTRVTMKAPLPFRPEGVTSARGRAVAGRVRPVRKWDTRHR